MDLKSFLIALGLAFGAVFLFVNGLLMLLAPDTHVRFLRWWSHLEQGLYPLAREKGQIRYKLAALMFLLFGTLAGKQAFLGFREAVSPSRESPTLQGVPLHLGPGWFYAAVGIALFLIGTLALIRPENFARWILRITMPGVALKEFQLRASSKWLRLMGLLFAAAGVHGIILWLRGSH